MAIWFLPNTHIRQGAKYEKKEFVYTIGDVQKDVGFVSQGLLRKYYMNEKGSEIITGFIYKMVTVKSIIEYTIFQILKMHWPLQVKMIYLL